MLYSGDSGEPAGRASGPQAYNHRPLWIRAVLAVREANNALILTRIKRQALIWRNVIKSPDESPLEPEIGREELERRRETLLQQKP
jgi:hypothetical protein